MKRTIINGLVAGLSVGMLAACGGASQDSSASSSRMLADGEACAAAWNSATVYNVAGIKVSRNGRNYTSAYWTQGDDPATKSGPQGSGQPWVTGFLCGGTTPTPTPTPAPTPTPTPAPTPTPTPAPSGFSFGPYKDVTINLNWNTNVLTTKVTGTAQPVLSVLPAKARTVTWSFATGECGSENWGGVQGQALANANVAAFNNAGRKYILSTGGAAGSFTCGSDAGFQTFINRYNSASLVGVDFDIESGQSAATIDALVKRVKAAQSRYPNLRFSFTLATLGGSQAQSLGQKGVDTMNAIRANGLTNYYINLMVMDYGSTNTNNCVVVNGRCDMAQSAIKAAQNLRSYWGVPYNRIELTPMIGGNDTQDETFTLANVNTMSSWAKANGLAGIHYWSLDRDTDCAPGFASPTCNSYGVAGNWGFTNRFISALGL